jgi:zinc/manganese transport system permease protein
MIDYLFDPFGHYSFMKRALAACVILSLSGTPLGVFLSLRRMTLVGDAMSHAILPGVALAFISFGLATLPLIVGGLVTGLMVAMLAVFLTRYTNMKEDASLTLLYLTSLASGVTLISLNAKSIDLLHMLFGNILAINNETLWLIAGVACVTILTMALFYRHLVIASFDPAFALAVRHGYDWATPLFYILIVINLIAAFQALGTLMALGIIILPALAARFWGRTLDVVVLLSVLIGIFISPIGLLLSYYTRIPSGPAVVLSLGVACILSAIVGPYGSLRSSMCRLRG